MPVFLSHSSVNKPEAGRIYNYLTQRRIACYVDVLDPTLKSTDDITAVIMQRIEQCTHMMAVVSQFTQGSWWVPFEIGVASRGDRRITTYKIAGQYDLPGYLSKWPILKGDNDLDQFVRMYQDDQPVSFMEGKLMKAQMGEGAAVTFHRRLKSAIGQR